MTLGERLAAAREQRRLAAGLPPSIDLTGPTEVTRDDDVVIDLRGLDRTPPAPSGPPEPSFSIAVRVAESADGCPSCGAALRLDMEDVVGGVDHYTCTGCGLLLQVAR